MVALYLSLLASPVCNTFSYCLIPLGYPLEYCYSALFLRYNDDDGVDWIVRVLLPYRLLAPRVRRELDVQSSRRRARRGMIDCIRVMSVTAGWSIFQTSRRCFFLLTDRGDNSLVDVH